jgi:hypothetical protein
MILKYSLAILIVLITTKSFSQANDKDIAMEKKALGVKLFEEGIAYGWGMGQHRIGHTTSC